MQIKDLKPNKKNPRKISEKKKEMLRASIEKFGDLSGFVFNRRSGVLISGHQRQKVVPKKSSIQIDAEYSTPTECRTVADGYIFVNSERFKYREVDADELWEAEAMLAANQHGGEWDKDLLADILKMPDMNLELAGFDMPELEELEITSINDGGNMADTKDDENDEPQSEVKNRVKTGQVWQLGKHLLFCGDGLDINNLTFLPRKIDLVYADPPYGINEETDRDFASRTRACKGNTFKKIKGDDSTDAAIMAFDIASAFSKKICLWGGNYYRLPPSPCWLVWDKRVEENQRDANSDCELAYVRHPTKKSVRIFRHLWKGMIKGSEVGQARVHPTQKPIALAQWAIEELDPEGKTVLDFFGGSGSTLLACEKLGRQCFMTEIEPEYCDVILARWEKLSGQLATLLS